MAAKVSRHSLNFPTFSVDFDVDIDASIELTRRFDSHGPDFVFAAADTCLRIEAARYHIVSERRHPGNLMELLRATERQLFHLPALNDIAKPIAQGHWGEWMAGYWDRLQCDASRADDEDFYNLLIPMSLQDGQGGHMAMYEYELIPTFEVATRPKPGEVPVFVWSVFDSAQMAHEVRELRKAIAGEILKAC